jgi:hypothetical protein
MRLLESSLALLSSIVLASCQTPPPAPGLEYLYGLNCTLAPGISVGLGPKGTRLVIPIIGGYFKGPKISGKVPSRFLSRLSMITDIPSVHRQGPRSRCRLGSY